MGASDASARHALPVARVLVVDDDHGTRGVTIDLLTDEGYAVVGVENGEDALRLLDPAAPGGPFRPHLILLDLRLPDMTGADFAEAYRRLPPPHAPIIVVSASRDLAHTVDRIRPVDVIAKPFDLEDLLARIGTALRPA